MLDQAFERAVHSSGRASKCVIEGELVCATPICIYTREATALEALTPELCAYTQGIPAVRATEPSMLNPHARFSRDFIEIPQEFLQKWVEQRNALLLLTPKATGVPRKMWLCAPIKKLSGYEESFQAIMSADIPDAFEFDGVLSAYLPKMLEDKEVLAYPWRIQRTLLRRDIALVAHSGVDSLYVLVPVMGVKSAAFVLEPSLVAELGIFDVKSKTYKSLRKVKGLKMAKTTLGVAAPKLTPLAVPKLSELQAVPTTTKNASVEEAANPEEKPKHTRKRATQTDASFDYDAAIQWLGAALPSELEVKDVLAELRLLRDLQMVAARKAANLAIKLLDGQSSVVAKTAAAADKLAAAEARVKALEAQLTAIKSALGGVK